MQQRLVSGGLIIRDGKFLLVKRAADDDFYPSTWEIPGGKLELGEKPLDGAEREVEEETGLDINIISPIGVFTYDNLRHDTQFIQVNYLCELVNENQEVRLSFEHSEYKWITFEELETFEISSKMASEIIQFRDHPLVKPLL
ncbi:MAG TPA: NUDIX hydrolase [Patescibacteria group bacterium]|nr:NUDIX hydrolase [Patescibacteria group bacterium]